MMNILQSARAECGSESALSLKTRIQPIFWSSSIRRSERRATSPFQLYFIGVGSRNKCSLVSLLGCHSRFDFVEVQIMLRSTGFMTPLACFTIEHERVIGRRASFSSTNTPSADDDPRSSCRWCTASIFSPCEAKRALSARRRVVCRTV